ncbi:mycofactocin-coupled SDR family oxidoreductase [Rhodococcus opacus]|uniref:mycofactocin-coupled SDR family oxidoreductase n=1 Tax=Rhodococcus opacus TaxID=37919 RepID=UPI0006BB5288|nr:mycofactocin-coupled SDR family oxidoreductase [Rhodococcus opacus]MDJ0415364.1 mycofactocin-coupled SDR family oxidoreductase [Rhodococcus opacus]MDV7090947.1 mycofactocin-coupled SDR family oxidoreductase [Rhodococcus opacus]UNN04701.1 mycofactocin-coupled SDR family oxidoreductase [Rhodococcus opacus]WKN52497.1 mycofactocin-coupled SDR family oxidoreductase [Rhodococcus opacus]
MGRIEGKVAFITGAARGQGRAHAVRFASEGADIVAIDICDAIEGVPYSLSTKDDLDETAHLVRKAGGRVITAVADVRNQGDLDNIVAEGISEFGGIDILIANAGILTSEGRAWEISDRAWNDILDVNLTGVWRSVKAVAPTMVERNQGGSIVLTSSYTGLKGEGYIAHYAAAKHGVVGLMRSLAHELGPYNIRVNTVNPGNTATGMVLNDFSFGLLRPDLTHPGRADAAETLKHLTLMDVDFIEPEDIANAALWLASDEARFVTGVTLPIDAGWYAKST